MRVRTRARHKTGDAVRRQPAAAVAEQEVSRYGPAAIMMLVTEPPRCDGSALLISCGSFKLQPAARWSRSIHLRDQASDLSPRQRLGSGLQ